MARLVLGPMLRYVDATRAVIWVETDRPCAVAVLGAVGRTFTVHARHYAVVVVTGLAPGTVTPYDVRLNGQRGWPEAGPDPVIRTRGDDAAVRLAFGSCRVAVPPGEDDASAGPDALAALARELRRTPPADRPDLLHLGGDQIYADAVHQGLRRFVHRPRHGPARPPAGEVGDFEEYARLYGVAWRDPDVRWLFANVPTAMVFDDHEVHNGWNMSRRWTEQMAGEPWWPAKLRAALAAYWVYQHLGNLGPDELATHELLARVRASDGDAGPVLDAAVDASIHDDVDGAGAGRLRWGYVRTVGSVRLVVLDSRSTRVLAPTQRAIVSEAEWRWVRAAACDTGGGVQHLLLSTSVPWLLPEAIHHAEGWDEAVCAGRWGGPFVGLGERLRALLDLEHWASYRRSFEAMAALLREAAGAAATGPERPRCVLVLSGDVHYSYAARAHLAHLAPGAAPVWQLVCSPLRNQLAEPYRSLNAVSVLAPVRSACRLLARAAGVPHGPVRWRVDHGPWFDNTVAVLDLGPDRAHATWSRPAPGSAAGLRRVARLDLLGAAQATAAVGSGPPTTTSWSRAIRRSVSSSPRWMSTE